MGGNTLNFDEQWVLIFKRVGDKVQLIRRNVHYKANSRLARREGRRDELHRLGPDGPADQSHQPDPRRRS